MWSLVVQGTIMLFYVMRRVLQLTDLMLNGLALTVIFGVPLCWRKRKPYYLDDSQILEQS